MICPYDEQLCEYPRCINPNLPNNYDARCIEARSIAANRKEVQMSSHTPKTQQVVALPCEQRVQTTLDTLKVLENNLDFLRMIHANTGSTIRKMTTEINKLRLVLEAK